MWQYREGRQRRRRSTTSTTTRVLNSDWFPCKGRWNEWASDILRLAGFMEHPLVAEGIGLDNLYFSSSYPFTFKIIRSDNAWPKPYGCSHRHFTNTSALSLALDGFTLSTEKEIVALVSAYELIASCVIVMYFSNFQFIPYFTYLFTCIILNSYVAGCRRAETFSQLSSNKFAPLCILHLTPNP